MTSYIIKQMNLYDLPKDLLIKMISEIEQQTIIRYEENLKERLRNERINANSCCKCGYKYSFYYEWKYVKIREDYLQPICRDCALVEKRFRIFSWNANDKVRNHLFFKDVEK